MPPFCSGSWSTGFGGLDALGDNDGDGGANLFDYAMLGSPMVAGDTPTNGTLDGGFPTLRFRRSKLADSVALVAEASADLHQWTNAPITEVRDNGDGTETVTARAPVPLAEQSPQFLRLRATLRP